MIVTDHDSDRIGGFLITLIGAHNCERWFRNAVFDVAGASSANPDSEAADGNRTLPVTVPSRAAADWIEAHYQGAILRAARCAGLDVDQVRVVAREGE
ncbi:MAG: hypothetical protein QF926_06795 [Alphaproteobacteria bacterium]|jgi:hypothetical protein|nr:hypothetical protein [Alphaproteobacteria bacterium]